MKQPTKGAKIRVQLHGHEHEVDATVTAVMQDGIVKATIDDREHPLALVDGKPRDLTVSPDLYEVIG